jgi:hypothetical protein
MEQEQARGTFRVDFGAVSFEYVQCRQWQEATTAEERQWHRHETAYTAQRCDERQDD